MATLLPYLPLTPGGLLLAIAILATAASAIYSPTSSTNFVVYWGQDSSGKTSAPSQQRLSHYCVDAEYDVINLAFLSHMASVSVSFYGQNDYCGSAAAADRAGSNSTLPSCDEIADDIKMCQNMHGKTVLLSIGGGGTNETGFTSADMATQAARDIWKMFGPPSVGSTVSSLNSTAGVRPFGSVYVNGFDLDIEANMTNIVSFAAELRALTEAASAGAAIASSTDRFGVRNSTLSARNGTSGLPP